MSDSRSPSPADLSDALLEELTSQAHEQLYSTELYWQAKRIVKEEIIKPNHRLSDLSTLVPKFLEDSGLSNEIRNCLADVLRAWQRETCAQIVNHSKVPRSFPLPNVQHNSEALDIVKTASLRWTKRLSEKLLLMSKNNSVPLLRPRTLSSEEERKVRYERLDAEFYAEGHGNRKRFLFDYTDFLDCLCGIQNPNNAGTFSRIQNWGMIKVELKAPSVDELKRTFQELLPTFRHFGVDDSSKQWWVVDRHRTAKKVTGSGDIEMIRTVLRQGCHPSTRPALWQGALDLEFSRKNISSVSSLQSHFDSYELYTDELVHFDIRYVSDNDNFFVFEEVIEFVLNTLQRDESLAAEITHSTRLLATDENGGNLGLYPPSGIIPYKGLGLLVAPLCLMFKEHEEVYLVFRKLYLKYLRYLTDISTSASSILRLCRLFEILMQTLEPSVCYHIMQLGSHPLKFAFPWMFQAFSGSFSCSEILVLWDRILGFDSLDVLPMLAFAIFKFRRSSILKVKTEEELEEIMNDFTRLKVMPLLQLTFLDLQ